MFRMRFAMIILVAGFAMSGHAANWPQFRGPNCSGLAENEEPPTVFSEQTNLVWKVKVPLGHSSPVIWQDRIFLTGYNEKELQSLCFDRKGGELKWSRLIDVGQIQKKHRANNPASSTPVTDGRTVCSYFPSFGLVAYDLDGAELWRKPLPEPLNPYGAGASPSLVLGNFVLNCEDDSTNSCLLAVNPQTGATVWKSDRRGITSTYSTPILWSHDGREDLMHASSFRLIAFDRRSGRERWFAGGLEWMSQVATPVLGEGLIFVMSRSNADEKDPDFQTALKGVDVNRDGKISKSELPEVYHRWWFKMDANGDGFITEDEWKITYSLQVKSDYGLMAFKPGNSGDVTEANLVWKYKKGIAQVPSPLYYRGILYMVNDGGRLTAFEASSGKVLIEQERLDADGEYFASPVAAAGKIYFTSNRGLISVVAAGPTLHVVARNNLAEEIMATPAIADNKLYVRSKEHLWAFGDKSSAPH